MANRGRERDWAQRIPRRRHRGEYEDYGWERHQSTLPEFRDPSVHEMPYEREERWPARESDENEGWYDPDFRRAYDYDYGRGLYLGGDYDLDEDVVGAGYAGGGYPRRQEDWNVPGPYTGIGPKGYQRSSDRIKEEVSERLTQHGQIDASEIEVSVENGEVTLEGTVPSRSQKRQAEDVAEVTMGVIDVHNRLRLKQAATKGMEQSEPGAVEGKAGTRATER